MKYTMITHLNGQKHEIHYDHTHLNSQKELQAFIKEIRPVFDLWLKWSGLNKVFGSHANKQFGKWGENVIITDLSHV